MTTQKPAPHDPFYLAFSRKLVLLILLVITTAMGLVALLMQVKVSIRVLDYLLADTIMGLVAGFSVRWIIPRKALVLRICSTLAFILGSLILLGWFTGWGFGIDPYTRADWWKGGQILMVTSFALLALFAWQRPSRTVHPATHARTSKKMLHPRRKPIKRPGLTAQPRPASPALNRVIQPAYQPVIVQPAKPKRKRAGHPKPKLLLSDQEEHRCPYCLELIDPNDRRGVVECKICHTLHHADCWAITGACQVPHFTA
jgi:uncharacterized Zn-finger protein